MLSLGMIAITTRPITEAEICDLSRWLTSLGMTFTWNGVSAEELPIIFTDFSRMVSRYTLIADDEETAILIHMKYGEVCEEESFKQQLAPIGKLILDSLLNPSNGIYFDLWDSEQAISLMRDNSHLSQLVVLDTGNPIVDPVDLEIIFGNEGIVESELDFLNSLHKVESELDFFTGSWKSTKIMARWGTVETGIAALEYALKSR